MGLGLRAIHEDRRADLQSEAAVQPESWQWRKRGHHSAPLPNRGEGRGQCRWQAPAARGDAAGVLQGAWLGRHRCPDFREASRAWAAGTVSLRSDALFGGSLAVTAGGPSRFRFVHPVKPGRRQTHLLTHGRTARGPRPFLDRAGRALIPCRAFSAASRSFVLAPGGLNSCVDSLLWRSFFYLERSQSPLLAAAPILVG